MRRTRRKNMRKSGLWGGMTESLHFWKKHITGKIPSPDKRIFLQNTNYFVSRKNSFQNHSSQSLICSNLLPVNNFVMVTSAIMGRICCRDKLLKLAQLIMDRVLGRREGISNCPGKNLWWSKLLGVVQSSPNFEEGLPTTRKITNSTTYKWIQL